MKKDKLRILFCGFVIGVLTFAASANAQDDTLKILFVGNSHTYFNDLPGLFANLSLSGGRPVITGMSAPGGYTLEQHTTNPTTLAMIAQGDWDYVSLQEQSQYPVIDFYRYGSMYPSARFLDSLITSYGERTVFYMTWGWKNGGIQTIDGHSSIDFVDYFQMQDSVTASYTMIANELGAVLSPVGNAWATARTLDTTVDLWQSDNSHATLKGSYLAACVFYQTLFHASPVGLTYTAGLSQEDATFLQSAAEQAVLSIDDDFHELPVVFELYQNYPNPFNPATTIKYYLPKASNVTIEIYDLLGRMIEVILAGQQQAGYQQVIWKADKYPSSVYFYEITTDDFSITKKMLLLK